MIPIPKTLAVAAVVAVGAALGNFYGIGAFMLTLAAGVLLAIILILWSSLQNLTGDAPLTFEEALSLGAVTPEEERKRAVIRTLKDLDYERTVGKISEEDFHALSAQYREEARRLLRSLDDDLAPARQQAEALLLERLKSQRDEHDASPQPEDPQCPSCGKPNDDDARFCKHCGAPLQPTSDDEGTEP